jgi:hypothetical protein
MLLFVKIWYVPVCRVANFNALGCVLRLPAPCELSNISLHYQWLDRPNLAGISDNATSVLGKRAPNGFRRLHTDTHLLQIQFRSSVGMNAADDCYQGP